MIDIDGVEYDTTLFTEHQRALYNRINGVISKKNELELELDNMDILSTALVVRLKESLTDEQSDSTDEDLDIVYNTSR